MSAATKSRSKPGLNGHRQPLPVAPAPVQTSTLPPADPGRYDPAVKIALITPSPTNPRKTFEPAYLAELGASIREVGLIEPILLRPRRPFIVREKKRGLGSSTWRVVIREDPEAKNTVVPEFSNKESAEAECERVNREARDWSFELVVGECRWRAHKEIGLETIAATIRELDDRQVAEIQLVENLQRKDVDPVDEAQGFQALLTAHDYTADRLAERVGKSKAYIYGALKMLAAPPKLLNMVRDGEASAAVAQLFGRIPNEKMRAEAFKDLFNRWGSPSFRDAKTYIERECMIELKGAPFDTKDAALSPAGACGPCPYRTGNDPVSYPDARADICTNPTCYREKVEIHGKKAIEAAKGSGKTVLDDAKKLFSQYGGLNYDSGYIDLEETCHETRKSEKWRKTLGKEAKEHVVLATDQKGVVHELVPKTKAQRILRDKGFGRSSDGSSGERGKRIPPAEALNQKVKAETCRRLMERSVAAAKRAVKVAASLGAEGPSFLRPLVTLVVDGFWHELRRKILKRRDYKGELTHLVNELPQDELLGVLVEAMVCKLTDESDYLRAAALKNALGDLLTFLDIDKAKVEKEVREELKAKAAKNGKAAKR